MTNACREVEVLLSLSAADALEGAEAATLEAHLLGCPDCRTERERLLELLGQARIPPPDAAESLVLSDLSGPMLRELRRRERRSLFARRTLTGGVVAAAVALALLAPALLRDHAPTLQEVASRGVEQADAVTAATWEEPDPTALWSESAVLDLSSSSADGATLTDAVFTAYDASDGS